MFVPRHTLSASDDTHAELPYAEQVSTRSTPRSTAAGTARTTSAGFTPHQPMSIPRLRCKPPAGQPPRGVADTRSQTF